MDIDLVRINGAVFSQKSSIFQLSGVPYTGITGLDFADNLEAEHVHGANRDGAPLGYTSGKYKPDNTTLSMLADVFRLKFLPQMAALSAAAGSPGSLAGARFVLSAQYVERPLPPCTDILTGCRIIGVKDTYAEGAGVKLTEVTLMLLTIERNGITLFDRARGIV